MNKPLTVEKTSRQVIEYQLLTALEQGDSVAILATESDLEKLILACRTTYGNHELTIGLEKLKKEAFGA